MKEASTVKHKLRQVIFRHRKQFIKEGLKQCPGNCRYNAPVKVPPGPGRRKIIRVCLYKEDEGWNNVVCDENEGGLEQARTCPYFECKNNATDLKSMFSSLLGLDGTPVEIGWIAKHYPDVAALTWVLGQQPKAKPPEQPKPEPVLALVGEDAPEEIPEAPLAEPEVIDD